MLAIQVDLINVFVFQIAFATAKLVVPNDHAVALGLFISGVCPGGGVSNIYSHLLDGDLSLSITMTTISTIAALGIIADFLFICVYLNLNVLRH